LIEKLWAKRFAPQKNTPHKKIKFSRFRSLINLGNDSYIVTHYEN